MSTIFNPYRNKALPKEDSKLVWKSPENCKALLCAVIRHGKSWKAIAADVRFSHLGQPEALRLKYHAFENGKDPLDEHLLPLLGESPSFVIFPFSFSLNLLSYFFATLPSLSISQAKLNKR